MAKMAKLKRTRNVLKELFFFSRYITMNKKLVQNQSAPINAMKMHAVLFELAKLKKSNRKKNPKKMKTYSQRVKGKIKEKTNGTGVARLWLTIVNQTTSN